MQSPFLITSLVLLYLKIAEPKSFLEADKLSLHEKLRKIDYLGSLTLVSAIGCLLLGMSLKTSGGVSFSDDRVWGLLVGRLASRATPPAIQPSKAANQPTFYPPTVLSLSSFSSMLSFGLQHSPCSPSLSFCKELVRPTLPSGL